MKTLKKGILFLSLMCIAFMAHAQDGEMKDRVEAQFIGFITNKLELTSDQATAFFPLYREHKDQERSIKKSMRPSGRMMNLSEEDAQSALNKMVDGEQQILDLKLTYLKKYQSILSAKQILQLYQAERSFKEELIKEVRNRRQRFRRNNR